MTDSSASLDTPSISHLLQALDQQDETAVRDLISTLNLTARQELMTRLEPRRRAQLIGQVPEDIVLEPAAGLDPRWLLETMDHLRPEVRLKLYKTMRHAERVRLFGDFGVNRREEELKLLPEQLRTWVQEALEHPVESIGRLYYPKALTLRPDWTVERALEEFRRQEPTLESTRKAYVIDEQEVLLDEVKLRELILSDPETRVGELLDEVAYALFPDQDQEEAVRVLGRQEDDALAVVDRDRHLLGVITREDVMEVARREETEDFHRVGGAQPFDEPYLSTGVGRLAWKRVGWLFLLFFAGGLSSAVLDLYEATLSQVIVLSFFIPLMIGTGGNAGSQTVTTVIRALAVGEVRVRHIGHVVLREALVGLMVGGFLGVAGFFFAWGYWSQPVPVAVVLGLAMPAVCLLATLVASVTPLLAELFGQDPAVLSAPVITTLVDVVGLIMYFSLAILVLGL